MRVFSDRKIIFNDERLLPRNTKILREFILQIDDFCGLRDLGFAILWRNQGAADENPRTVHRGTASIVFASISRQNKFKGGMREKSRRW